MNSYFDSIDGLLILHLEGRVAATQTGTLCDHLVDRIRDGDRRLIVVCAPGVEFARPAVRGLIVAATLIRAAFSRIACRSCQARCPAPALLPLATAA